MGHRRQYTGVHGRGLLGKRYHQCTVWKGLKSEGSTTLFSAAFFKFSSAAAGAGVDAAGLGLIAIVDARSSGLLGGIELGSKAVKRVQALKSEFDPEAGGEDMGIAR